MDLLATYQDADNAQVVPRLQYVSATPAGNQWTASTITPDTRRPRVWNPKESAGVNFKVVPTVTTQISGNIVVVIPFGVSDSAYFGC